MRGRVGPWTLVALVSAALAHPEARAGDDAAPAARLERFEWGKDVDGEAPIRALRVRNEFGDIRARRSDGRRLAVSAVIQRLDPAPQGVGVTVERRGSLLVLTVAYPPGQLQDSNPSPQQDKLDRLDLTAFLPEGVALDAATTRGTIEASGLMSDVTATTLGGAISLETNGAVRARTETGDLRAILNPAAGVHGLRLESDSGAISVTLPAATDLEVHAESTGAVTGDLFFERRRVGPRTYAEVKLGHGRRTLYVLSESGPLDFTRLAP